MTCKVDRAAVLDPRDGGGNGFGNPEMIKLWRSEVAGNRANLFEGFAYGVGNFRIEVGRGGILSFSQCSKVFDDEKALSETVVEFPGDTFAFLFL